MLDSASLFEALPETITIARTDETYHYAFEGTNSEFVDTSSVDGLTASLPVGEQVAMTIMKTSTDGVVSTVGDVVIQLFSAEGEAPNSSNHFLDLVESDYYEGLKIHRVISDFMWQGGSPKGDGIGGSGLSIADEYSDVLSHSRRGTVAYANSGPGTSDAQFYVTFDSAVYLDGSYNVFGYVVSGYDVMDELEGIEVAYNASGEKSAPVDTYTFTNVHLVSEADQTSGVLRLTTDYKAEGTTSLSFTSTNAEGETVLQQTSVYVGSEGLGDYVAEKLSSYDFNIMAGESVNVSLPAEFGGYSVSYTITANEGAKNYEIVSGGESNAEFTLKTTAGGAQDITLTISAKVSEKVLVHQSLQSKFDPKPYESDPDRYSIYTSTTSSGVVYVYVYENLELAATATQEVKISATDQAPTVSIVGTPQGSYEDVLYVGGSFVEGTAPIQISVSAYQSDASIVYNDLVVGVDGVEQTYTVASHSYDESTGLASYVLNLLADPAEGEHTITVQRKLSSDKLSEAGSVTFVFDPEELEFVDSPTAITSYVGVSGTQTFKANKTNEDGSQRGDVTYAFAAGSDVPAFLTLSSNGVLTWSTLESGAVGTYTVSIVATDALGRTATESLTFNVAGAPVFADFTDTTAKTGEEYLGQVVAEDALDPDAVIRYELVGESNLAIDSATGVLSWNIPADYLAENVKAQSYSFTVTATEQIKQEDGSYVDGPSVSKTFTIEITNSAYVEDKDLTPTWKSIDPQTVKAGETFTLTAIDHVPTDVAGVQYWFEGDVPAGMTIDAGVISWSPAADYFGDTTTYSKTLTINVGAVALISVSDTSIDYGESATTSFRLTVLNPNYVDAAPVFGDVTEVDAVTGKTYKTTIVATDPNGRADLIIYELVGDNLPANLSIGYRTGVLTWDVPEDYLDSCVRYQSYLVTIKATELYAEDDEEDIYYSEGLSSTKTIAIYVDNLNYDEKEAVIPTMEKIADQTITAGDTFKLTLSAKAEGAESIIYDITGDRPDGMTITEKGVINWASPSDYVFGTDVYSTTIEIKVVASAIMGSDDVSTDFSGSTTTSFKLTVKNPNYVDAAPVFTDPGALEATTGKAFSKTIVATDPNKSADRIVYKLEGTYPDGLVISETSGVLAWSVPKDLMASSISSETISIKITAIEQHLQEDGKTYKDGLSTTQTFDILVKNASYNGEKAVAPTWTKPEAATVTAGEKLETTVVATVPSGSAVGVKYSLGDDAPEGLAIDASTGKVTWNVPANYIEGTTKESVTVSVKLNATAIISTSATTTTYGDTASTTLDIVVKNPNYVNPAPVFDKVESIVGETGKTITATITATDPIGDADRIVYSLENKDLPKDLTIDATTGKVTWKVAGVYLESNISAQVYTLKVTATKQYLQEDGTYKDGPAATQDFECLIANASADAKKMVSPTISAIADQTVAAGKKLTFTVSATLAEGTKAEGVRYSFADSAEVPEGMTIDAKTGVVTWAVPADYFASEKSDVESASIKVKVQAQTLVSSSDYTLNYGGSASTDVKVTIVKAPEYDNWAEWFEDWVNLAQERYDSHAANLASYLASYLEAVDARNAALKQIAADYKAGDKTLSEAIAARKDAQETFTSAVADAREALTEADAKTDKEYSENAASMTTAYKELVKENKTPEGSDTLKDNTQSVVNKESVDRTTGSSSFRLSNKSTGASVATNLKDVLTMWRSGYSSSSIYDDIFADTDFSEDDKTEDNKTEGDKAEGDKTEGDKTEGDKTEGDKADENGAISDEYPVENDKSDDDATKGDAAEDDKSEGDIVENDADKAPAGDIENEPADKETEADA